MFSFRPFDANIFTCYKHVENIATCYITPFHTFSRTWSLIASMSVDALLQHPTTPNQPHPTNPSQPSKPNQSNQLPLLCPATSPAYPGWSDDPIALATLRSARWAPHKWRSVMSPQWCSYYGSIITRTCRGMRKYHDQWVLDIFIKHSCEYSSISRWAMVQLLAMVIFQQTVPVAGSTGWFLPTPTEMAMVPSHVEMRLMGTQRSFSPECTSSRNVSRSRGHQPTRTSECQEPPLAMTPNCWLWLHYPNHHDHDNGKTWENHEVCSTNHRKSKEVSANHLNSNS